MHLIYAAIRWRRLWVCVHSSSTILCCHRDFEGPAWVQYDRAYRRQSTITKNPNWSQINTTFYSLCFVGRAKRNHICSHCSSNNHGCPEALFSPPSLPHQPHQRTRGWKCHYKACRFLNACLRCRGGHPVSVARGEPGDANNLGAKHLSSRME